LGSDQKVAVVTGSSSGIGLETALTLARNGFRTYATMRNPEKRPALEFGQKKENLPINILQLDVTNFCNLMLQMKNLSRMQ
jgi:NAD(P)-dependent dehydrogenase (short-subunit alcohol dehydrogenase family)